MASLEVQGGAVMIGKREVWALCFLLIVSGVLSFYAIGWGVPGEARKAEIFSNPGELEYFLKPMESAREDIYRDVGSFGEELSRGTGPEADSRATVAIREPSGTRMVPVFVINSLRSYLLRSYGADEQRAIIALSRFKPSAGQFNPHYFQYGGGYLYPLALAIKVADWLKFLKLQPSLESYLQQPGQMGRVVVVGRAMGMLAAVLSLVFFYLFVRLLFDERTALFASFLYAVCPALVLWAHYLKPYSYALLWFNGGLFFCASVLKRPAWRASAVAASAFAGLAAGSLSVYGYAFFGVLLAAAFRSREERRPFPWRLAGLCLAVFFGVFLLVNPYLIPSFREFLLEARGVSGMWSFGLSVPALAAFFGRALRYGLGTVLYLAAALGVLAALFRRRREDLFLLVFIIPFLLYGAASTAGWVHYTLPAFSILIILAARFIVPLFSPRRMRVPAVLCLLLVAVSTAFCGVAGALSFREPNTRDLAGEWIKANLPRGSAIAMPDIPSPWRTPAFPFADYNLKITGLREDDIRAAAARFFLLSEYHWLRGRPKGEILAALRDCGYAPLQTIERPARIGPFVFRRADSAPEDWCHPNPTFIIFERRGQKP